MATLARLIHRLEKKATTTPVLVDMRVADTPEAMPPIIVPSKNTLMVVAMKAKRKFLRAAVSWAVCIGIGFASNQLSEEVAYAVEWPAVQLDYDFVSDAVQAELSCDLFDDCLHIEVLNTSQCKTNVSVDIALEDQFGQLIGSEEVIVPSPKFKGGFVIEIGANGYDNIDTFGIYTVSCSSVLSNVVGAA